MSQLRRLLGYVRPYWPWLLAGLGSMLITLGLNFVIPRIIRTVIDLVVLARDPRLLQYLALSVVGVAVLRGLFVFLERYSMEYMAQRVIYDLRNALYTHLQALPFSFYDHAQTGQLMSRATGDVETLRRALGFGLVQLLSNVLTLLGALALMLWIDWRLTLVAMATVPFLAMTVVRFATKVRPAYTEIQQQLAELTSCLQENVTGVRVVRAFAQEGYEREKFARQNRTYLEKTLAAVRLWAYYFPLINFLTGIGSAAIIWYGGLSVAAGRLTVGGLVAFNAYLMLLVNPMRMLGWVVNLAQRAIASSQRVFEILDTSSDIEERPGAIELPPVEGAVSFEGVSFAYGASREATAGAAAQPAGAVRGAAPVQTALRGFDLRVPPGRTVALLGATGSGKSTVINLIPRFYDPSEGRLTIDGHDIRDVTLKSLRRQIGIVLQETFLFSASIKENIAYGRSGATHEQIVAAAKAARIHDFIVSLPDGYATLVGERGVGLSGGQKQRVAIARALLMDPRILILDDSTSSVDTETEHLIQEALSELMRGRTTFVIAQRLSTVKRADLIVVLEDGAIADMGRHEDLLDRCEPYRQIYELQLRPQEPGGTAPERGLA
ncbi:MAG: ABC transporter ATP-binding protein [Bacillota bacterium]